MLKHFEISRGQEKKDLNWYMHMNLHQSSNRISLLKQWNKSNASFFFKNFMLTDFKRLIKKLVTFTSLIVKRSESKNLSAILLDFFKISKGSIKTVTVYISSKTYFVYIAPANTLKNQVRRISQ